MKKVKEAVYNSLTTDATLTSLLGTGYRFLFWPEVLSEYPSITFFEVSTIREPADIWRSTYQIDVWESLKTMWIQSLKELSSF